MSIQAFANLLSVVLAFAASLFFCFGSAEMKSSDIGTLSGSYWDSNPHLRAFLIALKADYLCGAFLLCFAFGLQFLANVPGTLPTEPTSVKPGAGALLAILLGGGVGAVFVGYRGWLVRSLKAKFK